MRGDTIPAVFASRLHCESGHLLTGENVLMAGNVRRCLVCKRKWGRETAARKRTRRKDQP